MSKYNPYIHHRRSIRLRGYDYAQEGLYFITLCVQNRECIFGQIENGELSLNAIGKIAAEEWLRSAEIRDNIRLHEFIVMPNHVHGIIEITANKGTAESIGRFHSPSQTIGSIIRGYKVATIKRVKSSKGEDSKGDDSKGELQFAPTIAPTTTAALAWQRGYYEHIIRNEKAYENISNYIINNPLRWTEDTFNRNISNERI